MDLEWGDFYHFLLLNSSTQSTTFLMYCEYGKWSLPYFEYPEFDFGGTTIQRACKDLRSWLGITNDDIYFTGSVNLLGTCYADSRENVENRGRAQLVVVEAHGIEPHDIILPYNAEWKYAGFVQSAFPDRTDPCVRIIVRSLEACLDQSRDFLGSLSDERYRPGWFERASRFMVELATCGGVVGDSRVFQSHLTATSTMLQLRSSEGGYFLKSPLNGCNETKVTAMVAKLFPDVSPDIVGISDELGCFVSREFDDETQVDVRDAVIALGRLQLESIHHIGNLKEAGCPFYSLLDIMKVTSKWPEDFREYELNQDVCTETLPAIEKLCEELMSFQIPMTLVHGDFSTSNVGYRERGGRRDLVIYDWEYAFIGHPFSDFHRIHKHVSETVVEEYLSLWLDFESMERLQRAYNLARDLGWVLKACTALEWAKQGNAQIWSDLAKAAYFFAAEAESQLCL